ncbi:MAG TPA: UvrD-helicase domain-containing protein [Candidatus Bipolaricaulota bacterium]|nr:UvrD-helicase domain-containing protein [Candidatus Bipolaricaulota bacterium]
MDISKFNQEQKEAIVHSDGPLLIVAGAGTGKTTVITSRIAYLIEEKKISPDQILAVTFTEKASEEMAERVDRLLPYGTFDNWILTFHSFADRILRLYGSDMGLPIGYKLLDQTGQWILVKKNFDKFKLDYYRPLGNPNKHIHSLLRHFSRCKDELISPADYLKYAEELKLNTDSADFVQTLDLENMSSSEREEATKQEILRVGEVAEAYHVYQQLLLDNDCLDFGDLINYAIELFKKRPAILSRFRKQFKYILVDEFQDTNTAQYELIKMLAAPTNNLTVVGDDDQAIYRFRGASVSNIMQFKKDYPDAKEIVLINNYRSCQKILDKAYEFIKLNNPNRLEVELNINKRLISQKDEDCQIEYFLAQSQKDQADIIIKKIIELKKNDVNAEWNDFAILVRSNDSGEFFNHLLEDADVPHQFLSLKGLYSKPVILDTLAFFNLLDNYHEASAMYRVLISPWLGLPEKDVVKIIYQAKRKNESYYETVKQINAIKGLEERTYSKASGLIQLIDKYLNLSQKDQISKVFVGFLYDSGCIDYLKSKENKENQLSLSYLQTFYKKIQQFEKEAIGAKLADFKELMTLELSSGETGAVEIDFDSGPDMVKVMTVHGAKGLEFKYVFIPDLVERKFPPDRRKDPIEIPDALLHLELPSGDVHIEEERRLFYVAATRAKNGLFFLSAKDFGSGRARKPSRFLAEMGYEKKEIEPALEMERTQEKKDEKPFYEIPKRFSHSQLTAYESCPLKYKFANVLKIPVPGKFQFTFGDVIHRTLNQFLAIRANAGASPQADLFGSQSKESADVLSEKDLLEMYEKNWSSDWYPDKETEMKYRKKGRVALKNFYRDFEETRPDVWLLERPFTMKVGDYTISGRIDRIDKIAGDQVEIIDYKTGQAKESLDADSKRQLLLYQLAVEKELNKQAGNLVYYFLEGNKKLPFVGVEKDKEKLVQKILEDIRRIHDLDFAPTPGSHVCGFCDFKDICEYKKL